MKFLRQVGFEIRNIMKSKFLLVIGILIIVASIAIPVIGLVVQNNPGSNNGKPFPMPGGGIYYAKTAAIYADGGIGGNGQDPIIVGDVTVTSDNPFYWNLQNLMQQKDAIKGSQGQYSTPKAMNLASDFFDEQIQYYVKIAQSISNMQDYRIMLVNQSNDSLVDKFIYAHADADPNDLYEAAGNQKGLDKDTFTKKYISITPEEKAAASAKVDDILAQILEVVQKNDFPKYIAVSIQQQNDQIASYNDNIDLLQKQIIDNPTQEGNLNAQISSDQQQIKIIQTNTIPVLEYRLKKNIIPGLDIWQNSAITDVENNRNQLVYITIMSQDDFMKDPGYTQQYGTYQKYVSTMQKQIDVLNNNLIIAQKSLDGDKPDMKYVTTGTRSKTVVFLTFSSIIAMFGVLLGGWVIASEFQQGTIRLLMIRPKKRIKILMSKFLGAFLVCLGLYVAGSILNIIANGICFGFSDYAFPNYTISGPVGFFAFYIPEFLACIVPILFGFSVAFMLSTVVKNIAVSISVPVVCYVGCIIALYVALNRPSMAWLSWTPALYAWLPLFYMPSSPVQSLQQLGYTLSVPYGVCLLLVLSAICMFVSVAVFKKRDIAN